jgi:hypothetical protein
VPNTKSPHLPAPNGSRFRVNPKSVRTMPPLPPAIGNNHASGSPLPRTLASQSESAFGGEGLGVRGQLLRETPG